MKNLKKDFPILRSGSLVYCDSAASAQKPQQVIDRITRFYSEECAPVARGLYKLAERATEQYELAREKAKHHIGAEYGTEIVFTRGATEGINIVAYSWALQNLKKGDEIVLTELEHHANILPWQFVARQTGAIIRWLPILTNADLDYDKITEVISDKTKLVAVTAWSNVTGVPIDIDRIIERAKQVGACTLIDAAQAAPRMFLDVARRGCDFLVFSGHKLLGPTGIGILYVNEKFHTVMAPFQYGGGMVFSVGYDNAKWRDVPYRLEAGSPSAAQAIGLGAALDYLEKNVNFDELQKHEAQLCKQLVEGLEQFDQVNIIGPIEKIKKTGHAVTFTVEGLHAHDVATHLDKHHICVRAGNHCTQPLHAKLGITNSVRVSFYLYNTADDVEKILVALEELLG